MRLNKVKSKNATSYYIIRSVRRNGKNSSEIVRKLGTEKSIRETYGVDDVDEQAKEQLKNLQSAQMPVCPLMQTADLTTTVNAVLLQHSQ